MAVAAVVASELPGDTLPSAVGIFQHVITAAHQIKERPIVEALVRVVQTVDAAKVLCWSATAPSRLGARSAP